MSPDEFKPLLGGAPVYLFDLGKRGESSFALSSASWRMAFGLSLPCMQYSPPQSTMALAYKDFLGAPLGHLSHELLHTKYVAKERI
jgi:hypothetical protein